MNLQISTEEQREEFKRRWTAFMSGDKLQNVEMSKTLGISEDVLGKYQPAMQTDDDDAAVVKLYGPIVPDFLARFFDGEGMISGAMFEERLQAAAEDNDEVIVRINSPGGSVIEAALMHDAIAQARRDGTTVNAHVAAMSASAASAVMMAAGQISGSPISAVFVHNPRVVAYGTADQLQASADEMKKIEAVMKETYAKRYNDDQEDFDSLDALMHGTDGSGTWLTPELALAVGFLDSVDEHPDPDDDRNDPNASMADRVRAVFGDNINGNNEPTSGIDPDAVTASADGDQDQMGDTDQDKDGGQDKSGEGATAVATQATGMAEMVRLAAFNGIDEAQAGALAMEVLKDGGGIPEMATKLFELPAYHEKYHSRNVEEQKKNQGATMSLSNFFGLVASTNPNSGVARGVAEEKYAIEHQWQQDAYERDHDDLHAVLRQGAGQLIPSAVFWGGEREIPVAAIDTYSARDVLPSRIDYARTMPELVARTPILNYVTQAVETSATVQIPVVTEGADINEQTLGISSGSVESAETTEPTADDITIGTVTVRPELFDSVINIPAVTDILTEGWTQRVAYDSIQDQVASRFEEKVVQGGQDLSSANTDINISNAIRTGGGKALHRQVIAGGSAAFKANVPLLGSAYVFGSDAFDHLLTEPMGTGGGRTIISASRRENANPEIEGELNNGVPAIKSNHIKAGADDSSGSEAADWQSIYGAWRHCQFTSWGYMRAWLSDDNTRLWQLKFVTLAAVTFLRGPAFTEINFQLT